MEHSFSDNPGAQERHLIRRHNNPLFGDKSTISDDELVSARQKDDQEREEFYQQFQKILQEISEFSGQEESEKILDMKQHVDRMYEQCCGLAGNNQKAIDGMARLQDMIMQAIKQGAEGDANAMKELEQEEEARRIHKELLTHPIICDLLRPDSVIEKEELAASILSADIDSIQATLNLFQPEHLQVLVSACEELLKSLDIQEQDLGELKNKLQVLHQSLKTS